MADKRKTIRLRRLYRPLAALAALAAALWCGYGLAARRPLTAPPPAQAQSQSQSAPQTQGQAAPPAAGGGLVRKPDTWTFLLCALDQVSGHTDTIMVCTYDAANQTAGLVSLPRDTLVDRPGQSYHKLGAACLHGGVQELRAAVGEMLGIPIDHYALVDTGVFVTLVDELGGVDFDVPVRMCYDAPDQDLHIHYEPGLQHLTGRQALEVARCRKNSDGAGAYPHNLYDAYPDADVGRTRTQQALVKAIVQKALSQPHKLSAYAQLLARSVTTDLSLANLLWLAQSALGFRWDGLTTATLPGDGTVRYQGVSYCYQLDVEGSLAILNSCLDPYTTPITANMVRMVQAP